MPGSAEGGELVFEFRDKRSAGKGAAVDDFADRAIELRAQRSVMRLKIEKWYFCLSFFLLVFGRFWQDFPRRSHSPEHLS